MVSLSTCIKSELSCAVICKFRFPGRICSAQPGGYQQYTGRRFRASAAAPLLGLTYSRSTSRVACASEAVGEAENKPLDLDQCLTNIFNALSWDIAYRSITMKEIIASGVGMDMGMRLRWKNIWRTDGSFLFTMESDHFTWRFGSPGDKKTAWEVDKRGISMQNLYDDCESRLLHTWIVTGQWLIPSIQKALSVKIVDRVEVLRDEGSEYKDEGDEKIATPANNGSTVLLRVKMRSGQVQVFVEVDKLTWLPKSIKEVVSGDLETWRLQNWRAYGSSYPSDRILYPERIDFKASSGGTKVYTTSDLELVKRRRDRDEFRMPSTVALPADTDFDDSKDNVVKAWKTTGGHILVEPRVNGENIGYMILDTGASGFVIEKEFADKLDLPSFGELFVSGMAGKIPSQFRRAGSFELGPVTIRNPLFMEMPVGGLLTEKLPGPLVGIIGFDFFRSAVVEMRPLEIEKVEEEKTEKSEGEMESNFSIHLYSPQTFEREKEGDDENVDEDIDSKESTVDHYVTTTDEIPWQKLQLIAGLPHIDVEFSISNSDFYKGIFLVDTGAGGSGVTFLSRVQEHPSLQKTLTASCSNKRYMSGVGGQKAKLVNSGEMDWLDLAGRKHFNVPYLYISDSCIDISVYSYGIICMLVLARCRLIFDYAHNRAAFVSLESKAQLSSSSSSSSTSSSSSSKVVSEQIPQASIAP